MTTRLLSFHAPYRCADHGRCCTSNWPIPVESLAVHLAEVAIDSGQLRPQRPSRTPFVWRPDAPGEAPALVATSHGACVFYRGHGDRGCEIHRALGAAVKPQACRQFPRFTVHDPRGISVTLSHYCPTAAALLESADSSSPAIVDTIDAVPQRDEGLDARTSLPPRLRPDMLMDWDGWWEWERRSVDTLLAAGTADVGLARLRAAVEHARDWRPDDGPLARRIAAAFDRPPLAAESGSMDVDAHRRDVSSAIPDDLRPAEDAALPASAPLSARAHLRYLAAHAFVNWTAHLGSGLRTWLRSIEAAHAMVAGGMDTGTADLRLRHLADPFQLAEVWQVVERH